MTLLTLAALESHLDTVHGVPVDVLLSIWGDPAPVTQALWQGSESVLGLCRLAAATLGATAVWAAACAQ